MQIFYGEKDIDYNNPNSYAFLNWCFDNSMGKNNKDNPFQKINDNFQMGKAYISNAIIVLYSIVYNNNSLSMADILIFPILFNIWHGIELWLKSSIDAINMINNTKNELKSNHNIYQYMDMLMTKLQEMNMTRTTENALNEVNLLIDEFKRVDAHFDFARYSFDNCGNYQFYNAPTGDNRQWQKDLLFSAEKIVPNTCVNLYSLFEIILKIAENFKYFVEFLILIISEGGELSDINYETHLKAYKNPKENLNNEADPLKKAMQFIYSHVF